MEDWTAYVRRHLPALRCPPECEAEIVEEIVAQLDGVYRAARGGGATDEEARARVIDEIPDWRALATDLLASKYPRTAAARRMADSPAAHAAARRPLAALVAGGARDVRYAARALAAAPLFTLAATTTLALAIGAATAVFSLVNAVLLAPLPFRDPARLVLVQQIVPEIVERYPLLGANPRSIAAWKRACRACDAIAVMEATAGTLTGGGDPEGVVGAAVSPNVFDVLGLPLLAGRTFTDAETRPGADAVVVLGHGLWTRRFGGDRSIVGRTIELDGRSVEVVGIVSPAVEAPPLEHLAALRRQVGRRAEFFEPIAWNSILLRSAGEYDSIAIVRLRAGTSLPHLNAELDAITAAEFRDAEVHPRTRVVPLREQLLGPWRRPLTLLLASVLAALAIACVNVANLFGGRWISRRRELAVRSAIGADHRSLLRLVAAETIPLSAAGGLAGLVIAWGGLRLLVHLAPPGVPRIESVQIDAAAFAFALLIALCCGMVCSVLPARQVWRGDAADTLKAAAHTTTGGPGAARLRRLLVGVEIGLASTLLVLGGLLVLSLRNVLEVDPGFDTTRVLAVDLKLPQARYPDAASRARFFDALLPRIESAAGIQAAGIVRVLPLEGEATVDAVVSVGTARPIIELPVANHLQISPGYFHALRLPLVAGRWLTPDDHGRNVALVSEQTARLVWPGENPLGRRFSRSNPERVWEVVGVVADARLLGLDKQAGLTTYVPYWSGTGNEFSVAVKTFAEPETALGPMREAVAALDGQLPLQNVRTMDAVLERTLATRRFQMRLMLAFAGAGLLLACLGVYSVVSAAVLGRRAEFAVRLALGATPARIARAVFSDALRPLAAGLVLGVSGAVAAASALAPLLFEVAPYDPRVIAASMAVILTVGVAACLAPALRATRTDPLLVLRQI